MNFIQITFADISIITNILRLSDNKTRYTGLQVCKFWTTSFATILTLIKEKNIEFIKKLNQLSGTSLILSTKAQNLSEIQIDYIDKIKGLFFSIHSKKIHDLKLHFTGSNEFIYQNLIQKRIAALETIDAVQQLGDFNETIEAANLEFRQEGQAELCLQYLGKALQSDLSVNHAYKLMKTVVSSSDDSFYTNGTIAILDQLYEHHQIESFVALVKQEQNLTLKKKLIESSLKYILHAQLYFEASSLIITSQDSHGPGEMDTNIQLYFTYFLDGYVQKEMLFPIAYGLIQEAFT